MFIVLFYQPKFLNYEYIFLSITFFNWITFSFLSGILHSTVCREITESFKKHKEINKEIIWKFAAFAFISEWKTQEKSGKAEFLSLFKYMQKESENWEVLQSTK